MTIFDGFPRVSGRKFELNFDGGHISSDAGVVFLSQIDRNLGLCRQASRVLEDPRQRGKVEHSSVSLLRQRVFGIACGYEDLNDHDTLRKDLAFQSASGRDSDLAHSSTLCRFENAQNRQSAVDLNKLFVETFIKSFKKPPKEFILDFDATDDEVHGQQEGRFFHGYYDHYCFLPLYVFCGEHLLVSYLRPSKIDGAKHSWAILALLVKRFRQQWPKVRIVFRGDSGFCRHRMLRWCEKKRVKYIVGIARNKRLERMSSRHMRKAEKTFNRTGKKARLFTDIYYAANSWDSTRRIIAKAEHNSQGSNNRYVITNMPGKAKELYDQLYCARGDMENRIKEQQLYLFADRTSCSKWWTNQFRLMLASMAYILIQNLRQNGLKNTKYRKAQANTIRNMFLKIGAVITRNTRRIKVRMSSAYPYKNLFFLIHKNLAAS